MSNGTHKNNLGITDKFEEGGERHKHKLNALYGLVPIVLAVVALLASGSLKHSATAQLNKTPTLISVPSEIIGGWDESQAEKIALPLLRQDQQLHPDKYCYFAPCGLDESKHFSDSIKGTYDLQYTNREAMVIAVVTSNGNTCHASAPTLSFFQFEKKGEGWKLTTADVGVMRMGQWGVMDATIDNAFPLGNDIYGIVFDYGSTHQGDTMMFTKIYSRIGDHFQDVFDEQTGEGWDKEDNPNHVKIDWRTTIKRLPEPVGFYNLLVERIGVGYEGSKETLYKFDGKEYVAADSLSPYQ